LYISRQENHINIKTYTACFFFPYGFTAHDSFLRIRLNHM
jgi:hypothetical protein